MTKKKTLVSESVIRRWGKLAAMPALTENFLDSLDEMEDEDGLPAEDEEAMEYPAAELGAEVADEEPAAGEEAAVERIVAAVVDAISTETGVDIAVDSDAGADDLGSELDDAGAPADELAMDDDAELEMSDELPGNRTEDDDTTTEELNLDVLDDEDLTEAVLKRVVARLLHRRK